MLHRHAVWCGAVRCGGGKCREATQMGGREPDGMRTAAAVAADSRRGAATACARGVADEAGFSRHGWCCCRWVALPFHQYGAGAAASVSAHVVKVMVVWSQSVRNQPKIGDAVKVLVQQGGCLLLRSARYRGCAIGAQARGSVGCCCCVWEGGDGFAALTLKVPGLALLPRPDWLVALLRQGYARTPIAILALP